MPENSGIAPVSSLRCNLCNGGSKRDGYETVVKGIRFLEVSFTECNLASFNEGFFPLGRSYRTE